jgi:hypothetical protein
VYVTAQPEADGSPILLDLRPSVRAESIDLRVLVSHRTATQGSASVESVAEIFQNRKRKLHSSSRGPAPVWDVFATRNLSVTWRPLWFSLWARKPIRQHLCKQEARIKVAMPIGDVLRAVFARPDENFYDDVLLVDENSGFLGFIAT